MAKRRRHNKGFESYFKRNTNPNYDYAGDAKFLEAFRKEKAKLLKSGRIIVPPPEVVAMQKYIEENHIKGVSIESIGGFSVVLIDDSVV